MAELDVGVGGGKFHFSHFSIIFIEKVIGLLFFQSAKIVLWHYLFQTVASGHEIQFVIKNLF